MGLLWLLFLFAIPADPLRAADVTVFAAASLTDALREIAAPWEKATGHRVVFNFGGSNILVRQIRASAPADLFLSADEAQMDALEKDGLVVPGTRRSVLSNALAVVVRTDATFHLSSAHDLASSAVTRLALADPRAVPAGVYARAWLEKAGAWAAIAPKILPAENVRAALAAVESGNADAGVVYATDARASNKVAIAFIAPPGESPGIAYPFALLRDAPSPEAARAFLARLVGVQGRAAFRTRGFLAAE
jgi:molybdate transport system substrate-binding protein